MNKKTAKNSKSSKNTKISKTPRKIHKEHHPFVAAMVLLVGFSTYGIVSFVDSTDSYIDLLKASVYDSRVSSQEIRSNEEVVIADPLENPFVDLQAEDSSFEAVLNLYYSGILSGYPDGTIRPGDEVNRAEFAKLLVQASDLDYTKKMPETLTNCFTDVFDLPGHWFAPAVCAARGEGWINGYPDGSFGPAQQINRAEAMKIVLTAFGYLVPDNVEVEVSPFDDVNIAGDWFLGVAVAARDNGFVSGDTFDPGRPLTRGELAVMVDRAMGNL
jgi:hypothetical protein